MKRFWSDLKRYLPYSIEESKADLHSEVANSHLKWLWWILEPFLLMLVFVFIYGYVFNSRTEYFPAFVFIGLTAWRFFTGTLQTSCKLIRSTKSLIMKVYMPKFILIVSRMITNAFKMVISYSIVIALILAYRIRPTVYIAGIVPLLLLLFVFTFGLSAVVMHIGVYMDDIANIIPIGLRLMMYFTGIFYSVQDRIPAPFGYMLLYFNPVAFIMDGLRKSLIYGQPFSAGWYWIWMAASLLLCAVGVQILYGHENNYIKMV